MLEAPDTGKLAGLRNSAVLPFYTGCRISEVTKLKVHDIFHRYSKKAGLPEGDRPHAARATSIT